MKKIIFILLIIPLNFFAQENVKMPVFPGCEESENLKNCFTKSIAKQLIKNTEYSLWNNEEFENSKVIETLKIQCLFTISSFGLIEDVEIQGKIKRKLRKQFIRNLEDLPILKPGTKNGKPVDLSFNLPVRMNLIE